MNNPIKLRSELSDAELDALDIAYTTHIKAKSEAEVAEAVYDATLYALADARVTKIEADHDKAVAYVRAKTIDAYNKAKADRLKSKQQDNES